MVNLEATVVEYQSGCLLTSPQPELRQDSKERIAHSVAILLHLCTNKMA